MFEGKSRFAQLNQEKQAEVARFLERFGPVLGSVTSAERLQEFLSGFVLTWHVLAHHVDQPEPPWQLEVEYPNCLQPGQPVLFSKPGIKTSDGILIAIGRQAETGRRIGLIYRPASDTNHSAEVGRIQPQTG